MRWALFILIACSALACSRAPASPAEEVERLRLQADRLHEKAIKLHGEPRHAERAAALHRQSARMRPASDPLSYHCYAAGAQVLIAAGRIDQARQLMEESAGFALARSDSLNAARSYAHAAVIAAEHGSPGLAAVLARRMKLVAGHSPWFRNELNALDAQIMNATAKAAALNR